jgi:uncharacterized protein (DUF1330 family)
MRYRYFQGLITGAGVCAALIFAVHAQTKPKAIAVVEIFESDHQAFLKDYAPLARKALESNGARYLSRGGDVVSIDGKDQPSRLTLVEFENMDAAKRAFASAQYTEARKIGDKYAKFKITAIEEVDQ